MHHFTRLRLSALAAALLLMPCGTRDLRAQESSRTDTLSGRVTSSGTNAPISGAAIFITRGPDRLVKQDTSNADGRWRVTFTPGTGDYLVFISAPGAESFRKRVSRAANEQAFVVDAQLKSGGATQLAAVRVRAQAPRPDRTDRTGALPTIGSNERIAEGVYGAVSPTAAGNPLATAATIPGLNVGPGGISALGAGGDQSLVTLNGHASGATQPREIRTRTRASLSNYDPAVGGFSGALVAQELDPGRENTRRQASFTLDAPALRASDALAAAYGLRPANFQLSAGQTGQLSEDRLFYASAAQASRHSASQASLLTSPTSVLALDGLDAADVSRIRQGLGGVGVSVVPTTPNIVIDQFNLVAQLDRTPRGTHALKFTGLLNATRSSGGSLTPQTLADASSDASNITAALQFGSAAVLGTVRPALNDFRTSISLQRDARSAQNTFAMGVLRVPDLVADPNGTVPTLTFGGYNGVTGTRTNTTWEATDEFSWLRGGRAHLFKLYAWSRVDALQDETTSDANGTFVFNTLADLTAGQPAVFTRTLAQPTRSGATWNGATAFTHRWLSSSRVFQIIWGARLEANRFLGAPARNPALESALDLRPDRVPSAIAISPRVGIRWNVVKDQGGTMTRASDLASRSSLPEW